MTKGIKQKIFKTMLVMVNHSSKAKNDPVHPEQSEGRNEMTKGINPSILSFTLIDTKRDKTLRIFQMLNINKT